MAKRDAISRFTDAASAVGIDVRATRYPEGTKTADEAARAIGCELGQIVKSLVFVADDGDRPVLALTSGASRVDLAKLAARVGHAVRRAQPDEVRAATGFSIGGTPPFGHTTALATIVDPVLTSFAVVWAAAGTPDSVFPITPDDLLRATSGDVVDVTESLAS